VNEQSRTAVPLAHVKVALQCGGSDAFSGISGNPLAAAVAREIIAQGGSANLAETPELVGAEEYILQQVRDHSTAEKFLATIERFKAYTKKHGISVEANPSGGNKYRGLYNITLKSLGAAMKRHPDVPLDYVIDYAEPMKDPGFYFMDSPGLDLESIAGQVASGCNLIFFVTGNGSITNFPFVPTIKIVTTTGRYQMLPDEMDVNAGAYLDGTTMESLAKKTFFLSLAVVSGQATVGEAAGHAQVQIWRNWKPIPVLQQAPIPDGQPLPLSHNVTQTARLSLEPLAGLDLGNNRVNLILPTSLCAAEIARLASERLNDLNEAEKRGLSRFLSLGHTEGCGSSSGRSGQLFSRLLINYATHPLVRHCLFLEHGCEVTHNDYFRFQFSQQGSDPGQFSWLSIQQDGGLAGVLSHISRWYDRLPDPASTEEHPPDQRINLQLGLHTAEPVPGTVARALGELTLLIAGNGGTVVVPDSATLLMTPEFLETVLAHSPHLPTLAHGQRVMIPGFHVMETQTGHWVETISGLGATGVTNIVAYARRRPVQGHPFIPVLVTTRDEDGLGRMATDLVLAGSPDFWSGQLLVAIKELYAGLFDPAALYWRDTDFQVTRGELGISL
jgi:altronate dehydratase